MLQSVRSDLENKGKLGFGIADKALIQMMVEFMAREAAEVGVDAQCMTNLSEQISGILNQVSMMHSYF